MSEKSDDSRDFFLVVPPGFEAVAEKELRFWCERLFNKVDLNLKSEKAGITINLPLIQGFFLNRVLKIPTRILFRIADFRCRDFTSLYKKVLRIDWNRYVGGHGVEWKASASGSRLKIESRIVETCEQAFQNYRKGNTPKKTDEAPGSFTIYLRIVDDTCQLSLDSSGEALYKRGVKKNVSQAPLRENLAAGLLWFLFNFEVKSEKLGLEKGCTLIDPMMGTGTFLIESLLLFQPIVTRSFAFEQNPVWRFTEHSLWIYQVKDTSPFKKVMGYDISDKNVMAAQENLMMFRAFSISQADLFTPLHRPESVNGPVWVITNPPYGQRIPLKGPRGTFYIDTLKAIKKKWNPQKIGIIVPADVFKNLPIAEKSNSLEFRNGGINVRFIVVESELV